MATDESERGVNDIVKEAGFFCGIDSREKSSNPFTIFAHLLVSLMMTFMSLLRAGSSLGLLLVKFANIRMPVSGLLISWVMPATSLPRETNFPNGSTGLHLLYFACPFGNRGFKILPPFVRFHPGAFQAGRHLIEGIGKLTHFIAGFVLQQGIEIS